MHKLGCLAPWKALAIKPNGDVVPDAQFEGIYGNLINQSFEEIILSPKVTELQEKMFFQGRSQKMGCSNCVKKEDSVGHSRRKFFTDKLGKEEVLLNRKIDIQYLDLNLSNKCNLKCRMCNSVSSSSWIKDEEKLREIDDVGFNLPKAGGLQRLDSTHLKQVFENRDLFKNLKYISFRGGEPLFENGYIEVLEKLVDWSLAKQVRVDLSTNGSFVNAKITNLLSQFKGVDLYMSIDGVGEKFGYVRGGETLSLENFEKNVIKFRDIKNAHIMYTVTLSIYNILYLQEIWDWYQSFKVEGEDLTLSNLVVRPDFLNFQILPPPVKDQIRQDLLESQMFVGVHESGQDYLSVQGRELLLSKLMAQPFAEEKRKDLVNKFLKFNESLDNIRGTSLRETMPEVLQVF